MSALPPKADIADAMRNVCFVPKADKVRRASLNYNPPDDTITSRTIVGFVLLGITALVFAFVIVVGLASAGIRRLHDRGKTGYWLLL